MAYCKWCGMESKDPWKCEWCGRPLASAPRRQTPGVRPVKTAQEVVEEKEEESRTSRRAFFISCAVLAVVASGLILWRYPLYPWVTIGSLFAAGIMLGYLDVIPPFEDGLVNAGIPLVLAFFFPAFFVCLGYVVYGLIMREMNFTIIWLLGVYLGLLTVLQIVTFIALPDPVPAMTWVTFRGVELLSLAAAILGWIGSGSLRLNR